MGLGGRRGITIELLLETLRPGNWRANAASVFFRSFSSERNCSYASSNRMCSSMARLERVGGGWLGTNAAAAAVAAAGGGGTEKMGGGTIEGWGSAGGWPGGGILKLTGSCRLAAESGRSSSIMAAAVDNDDGSVPA